MQPLPTLPPVPMGSPVAFEYEMTICAGIKSDPTSPQRSYPLGNGAVWVQYADRVVFCRSTPVSTGAAVQPPGFPANDPKCQGAVPIACGTVGMPNFDKNGDGKITDDELENGIRESCGTMDPAACTTAQQFGDHDKDGIPNIHDLTPEGDKGPNGEPPRLNPAGWVPGNLAILEHLFADLGLPVQGLASALSGLGVSSLPDKDGDGATTLADLISTVRDALVESAGNIGERARDYRLAARGSLSLQQWSQLSPDLVARLESFMVFR